MPQSEVASGHQSARHTDSSLPAAVAPSVTVDFPLKTLALGRAAAHAIPVSMSNCRHGTFRDEAAQSVGIRGDTPLTAGKRVLIRCQRWCMAVSVALQAGIAAVHQAAAERARKSRKHLVAGARTLQRLMCRRSMHFRRMAVERLADDATVTAHQVTHVENNLRVVGGQVLQGGAGVAGVTLQCT